MDGPFTRLASTIQLIAGGERLELPYALGPRNIEWMEYFVLGRSPYDGEETLLHGMRTRKNGVEKEMRKEPCFWSLNEMLQSLQDWDDETMAAIALPRFQPGKSEYLDALARLDQEQKPARYVAAGTAWNADVKEGVSQLSYDGEGKWTLDELVVAVKSGK